MVTRGLGVTPECSRRRIPWPPQNKTTLIERPVLLARHEFSCHSPNLIAEADFDRCSPGVVSTHRCEGGPQRRVAGEYAQRPRASIAIAGGGQRVPGPLGLRPGRSLPRPAGARSYSDAFGAGGSVCRRRPRITQATPGMSKVPASHCQFAPVKSLTSRHGLTRTLTFAV